MTRVPGGVCRVPAPVPPVWGARIVDSIPVERVFDCLDIEALYRLSWGAKRKRLRPAEFDTLRDTYDAQLTRMKRQARLERWFTPRAVYGYFPAHSDGDDLIIYEAPSEAGGPAPCPIARFSFPRQSSDPRLCLADYFAPIGMGPMDVVALQMVTIGPQATVRLNSLEGQGETVEMYYLHGFAAQMTEATAECIHRHIRQELGLAADRGRRFSWGYPALPDLAAHRTLVALLPAERVLGLQLTSADQFVPEYSTAALVVHHPDARYFPLAANRFPDKPI
jgi:5-methyltetrahydrofolate--homocysteine methyltransferase